MVNTRKFLTIITSCLIAFSSTACGNKNTDGQESSNANQSVTEESVTEPTIPEVDYSDLTSIEFSEIMGEGWNLGNSLDAYRNRKGDETAWGNPEINQELLKAVKEAGFDTIRIPVTYMERIGASPDYTIDSQWLDRVYEVTQMALSEGFIVIINIHHDGNNDNNNGAWIDITQEDQTEMQNKFEAVWKQLAEKFKDCPTSLVFESMNEIHDGSYKEPTGSEGMGYYESINSFNQIFVDTVRASGGTNAERFLLVPGFNTNIDYTIAGFKAPKDTIDNKLMVSVHYYDPYEFALQETMSRSRWGDANPGSVRWANESYVDTQFDKLKTTYVDNGIAVVMGEYGAVYKENDDMRAYYLEYVTDSAKERGIVPVYWDNGYNGNYGFALFDRETGDILHPDLVKAITE